MIKLGMLIQWKSTDVYKWGWYYKNQPTSTVKENSTIFDRVFQKNRIYEENFSIECEKKLLELKAKKDFELSQVQNDENKLINIKKIHGKYLVEEQDIEDRLKMFNHQYALFVVDKISHQYKVGNVKLKEKVYWKCLLTKRNGETIYIWVDDQDVEPFEENSYDIKNVLLKKHLQRRAAKLE